MQWIQLTQPWNNTPIWVNLEHIVDMQVGEFYRRGETCTRLCGPAVALAIEPGGNVNEGRYFVHVVEAPADILTKPRLS